MTAVVSILPTEYSRPEELKIQAQQGHHHYQQHYANNIQKENQDVIDLYDGEANEEDIVLLSPANTTSSSLSDDGTMSYPQTPTQQASHHPDNTTAINTSRLEVTEKAFEYNTMDDEAIMKSYLDPSPVTATTTNKNRKKGQALTRLKHILKNEGDDNNNHNSSEGAAEILSSSSLPLSSSWPPPRSPSRSNATLTTYTPQLDTSKIFDLASDSSSYHNHDQNHEQQEFQNQHQSLSSRTNNNNSGDSNIRSISSLSESTCSSTISSHSTAATSAASNKQHIVHDKISSPNHQHHLPHIHSDQHQHSQLRQPATKLSALAMHAAKRNEQYYFNHHQQNQHYHQHPSIRPIPTSSSRFKTALQIFRPNNNNNSNLHNHKNHNHSNHNNHNNHSNHSNTNNNNGDKPEPHHYNYSSQVNVNKNSISPSSVSEKLLQDNDGKEPTINIVPSKSKSLAGRLKSKFQKKPITNSKNNHNSKNNSNGGSTSSFTVNMSRSASFSSITSSWSRLTQSRGGDYSKQKKHQQKSSSVGSGPSNQQRQSPQHHFSAIIQHQDNNRESASSIYHSPARHSMYCTTPPMSTMSDDCRSLYHVQQEQKRRLHTHQHQQQQQKQKQKQKLHKDHYRHQHHGEQHQRPQYNRFRQQQHCHSQMGMDSKLTSSISTPAATTSPILRDSAARMSGSIITSSNITPTTESGRDNIINRNCNNNVRFAKVVSVRETYARHEYDRGSDPDAVCTRLTPAMAYFIKEELNTYKLHEMQVHEYSRENTHFFF